MKCKVEVEIPEDCFGCIFCYDCCLCQLTERSLYSDKEFDVNTRPAWCPLDKCEVVHHDNA